MHPRIKELVRRYPRFRYFLTDLNSHLRDGGVDSFSFEYLVSLVESRGTCMVLEFHSFRELLLDMKDLIENIEDLGIDEVRFKEMY